MTIYELLTFLPQKIGLPAIGMDPSTVFHHKTLKNAKKRIKTSKKRKRQRSLAKRSGVLLQGVAPSGLIP